MSQPDGQYPNMYQIQSDPFDFDGVLCWDSHNSLVQEQYYDIDSSLYPSIKNRTIVQKDFFFDQIEVEQMETHSKHGCNEDMLVQLQNRLNAFHAQQNLMEAGLQRQQTRTQKEQKENQYCLGHIDYVISCPVSIFGSTRKYQRSKKGKGSKKTTELQLIAKRMKSFKGNHLSTAYAKRFDQELNKIFRKLSIQQQDQNDITFYAIRNLIKNKSFGDNLQVFNNLIAKCKAQRHWSQLLKCWHSEKIMDWQEELNC